MNISRNSYKTADFDNETTQTWTTLVIFLLFAGIGVPIWWKTTEVYRATIPFDQIADLEHNRNLTLQITIELFNVNSTLNIDNMASGILKVLMKSEFVKPLNFDYQTVVKSFTSDPKYDSSQLNIVNSNVVKVIFAQKTHKDVQIRITNNGIIWCGIPENVASHNDILNPLKESITLIIKSTLVNEEILLEMVSKHYQTRTKFKFDDEFRKMVQTNPKFELLFSLLCPEPENVLAEWDIQQALQSYFEPVLGKLRPIFDFHVGSQILYYTKIAHKAKMQRNEKYYCLTKDQLSLVINPIEGRLGSQISSDPTLNFAAYVVEEKYSPLYIKKQDNSLSKTNAFLVPRWGSMVFYNIPSVVNATDKKNAHKAKIQMKTIMEPFFTHFRTLLGLQNDVYHSSAKNIVFDQPSAQGITDWEYDYLMRLRSLENVAVSIHTLTSLSKLLNQIKNIVINDNIAQDLYKAVTAVTKAKYHLSKGNLTEGFKFSKQAFIASETAFFDPTLLELLYFPEDQKFAIYIPLFLPISLPIVLSLLYAIKRIKNNSKIKKE